MDEEEGEGCGFLIVLPFETLPAYLDEWKPPSFFDYFFFGKKYLI